MSLAAIKTSFAAHWFELLPRIQKVAVSNLGTHTGSPT